MVYKENAVFDKTDCKCNTSNVNWYVRQDDDEDKIRVPDEVIFNEEPKEEEGEEGGTLDVKPLVHECKQGCCGKPSTDSLLRKFIYHCEELEENILLLNKYRDSYRTNHEFSEFRRELTEIKNKAIIEAYNRKTLEWKK